MSYMQKGKGIYSTCFVGLQELKYLRNGWVPRNVDVNKRYVKFLYMISDMASMINLENLSLLCTIFWRIWYIRNLEVAEKVKNCCKDVVWWCKNYVSIQVY
ncbi:hypothetical protein Ddye_030258 [Dipteronia dyeriana]|uniref:Uncharacterized protein n=1 Tax=Dipteronia dyeriana TaxID=168575 RepID=A0AAD9TGS5_9ROSI|nr:hypothetical protein Ddye_030258 [Dipteronia dyeriana]